LLALAQAGSRIGIPKAGKIHPASSQPLLPDIPYSRERMPDKDEITEFIFGPKISEPTRRILSKEKITTFFGIPSRDPACAMGSL
jgi:hypothetical protein